MSVQVWLYGRLRRLASQTDVGSNSIVAVEISKGETVQGVLKRLGLGTEEVSNIFLNGRLAGLGQEVTDQDRIGLFPQDMSLLYC